uniref:PiggyBac transposable element-derived protein 4 C-terminal zinc-ribbon domain-containing protein n=1 Tax=Magallana gigas TaxID=29159 RepID=K1QS18_MAGGI
MDDFEADRCAGLIMSVAFARCHSAGLKANLAFLSITRTWSVKCTARNQNFFINVHDDSSKTRVRKINDHSLVIIKSKKDCSFQEIHPYKRFGGKRFPCKYCTIHGVRAPISGRILRSYHGCQTCGVALCRDADRNCFFNYHKEILQNSEEGDRYISEYKLYPR